MNKIDRKYQDAVSDIDDNFDDVKIISDDIISAAKTAKEGGHAKSRKSILKSDG